MKFHFISIGGAVMHNLALALHKKGFTVTGSDDEIYEPAKSRLMQYNLLPSSAGWFPEKITKDLDGVILGMHAKADNPELQKAQELGLKIYSFPEFMYMQTANKLRIVVGGSHGKTTTTAMILHVLKQQNIAFDYLVGSQLEGFDTMVGFSSESKIAVFEGDEYLTSPIDRRPKFHVYKADIGIITGVAWDHMNVFPTYDIYKEQFKIFAEQIPANGKLIFFNDDKDLVNIIEHSDIKAHKISYSTPQFEINDGQVFVLHHSIKYPLQIFGSHNLQNMMAALFACKNVGINETDFLKAMATFKGTAKRMEILKQTDKSIIIRDFAHAPSKVKATVNAVKELHPQRKLIAVYELHTYSSLSKEFLPQYINTLQKADVAAVLYSKHALQMKNMPMLEKQDVYNGFGNAVKVFDNKDELYQFIKDNFSENTNLLLMSSGNFDGMKLDF
ncbi:MAG: UDP-N-acetylmuramate--L-alanine ligase [Bacteroidia bacterium]